MSPDRQTSLLDLPEVNAVCARVMPTRASAPSVVRAEMEAAIKRAEAGAKAWMALALGRIEVTAQEHATFTADDVWERIGSPGDPRALGPAMRKARRLRIIEPLAEHRDSNRASRHGAPIRVWRSLLYRG